jgi:hypothetical protein
MEPEGFGWCPPDGYDASFGIGESMKLTMYGCRTR